MFSQWAGTLVDNGYEPIPLEGKRPAVKSWNKGRISSGRVEAYVNQMPSANIGLRTGNLIGIDIDCTDPKLASEITTHAKAILGDTDFVRVGCWPKRVLFYRTEEFDLDPTTTSRVGQVEVLGQGCQVAVAGIHPDTSKPYYWPEANLLATPLEDVPVLKVEDLQAFLHWVEGAQGIPTGGMPSGKLVTATSSTWSGTRTDGRNTALFDALRERAQSARALVDLEVQADRINRRFKQPLHTSEVKHTVRSVWKYKKEGRLFQKGKQVTCLPLGKDEIVELAASPHALALYAVLRATRGSGDFTIPQQATAERLKWGIPSLRRAIKELKAAGLIRVVRDSRWTRGKKRTPTIYAFT